VLTLHLEKREIKYFKHGRVPMSNEERDLGLQARPGAGIKCAY